MIGEKNYSNACNLKFIIAINYLTFKTNSKNRDRLCFLTFNHCYLQRLELAPMLPIQLNCSGNHAKLVTLDVFGLNLVGRGLCQM